MKHIDQVRGSDGFLLTTPDGLQYDIPFRVLGVEMEDIDHNNLGIFLYEIKKEITGDPVFFEVASFNDWQRLKRKLSDYYVKTLRELDRLNKRPVTYYKDPKRFIVKFLFGPNSETILR